MGRTSSCEKAKCFGVDKSLVAQAMGAVDALTHSDDTIMGWIRTTGCLLALRCLCV